jgi:hypothetical protein
VRGELVISAPPLLFIEILNIAARRWGWGGPDLEILAAHMIALALQVHQPALVRIAYWASLGLTAYDACYVALAEQGRAELITADDRILAVAVNVARPLSSIR